MTDMMQQALRAMLLAKREMDAAWKTYQLTRGNYREAQSHFLGMYAESSPPTPIICGETFIKIKSSWTRADEEEKFTYEKAERCPTSD